MRSWLICLEGSDFSRKETEIIGHCVPTSMVGHTKSTVRGAVVRKMRKPVSGSIELNFLNIFIFFSFLVSRVQISQVKIEQFPSNFSVH